MGVHDFISFIQRNGQCIVGFDFNGAAAVTASWRDLYDECGSDQDEDTGSDIEECSIRRSVLVRVPATYSRGEVERWETAKFAQYQRFESEYHYDDGWRFEFQTDQDEYFDALCDKPYPPTMWKSKDYPGEWLVCFLPEEYQAFVAQTVAPEKIPRRYFKEVFEFRGLQLPPTKKEAFEILCGRVAGTPV